MFFSAISEDIIKNVCVRLKKLLRAIMELWELCILLAPIMWAYECGKDVANSESSSAKKCISIIGLVITLPLAFFFAVLLLSGLAVLLPDCLFSLISSLEKYGLFLIVLIIIAIIRMKDKNTAAVTGESGNGKLTAMLVAVVAVLALIGYGIISSMTK